MPTRTTPRSTSAAGRFGRATPPAGRFGRTPPPARRIGRTTPQPSRFGRAPQPRRASLARRRPAPRSKGNKALNALGGMIPGSILGRAAKPSAGAGKGRRAGTFALLAGAAGLAMKNRDKLPGPLGRKDTAEPMAPAAVEPDPLAP